MKKPAKKVTYILAMKLHNGTSETYKRMPSGSSRADADRKRKQLMNTFKYKSVEVREEWK